MKKLLRLIVALSSLMLVSCINENYSLENLDTTVTVLPGLTIPVKTTTDIPAIDFLGQTQDGILVVDDNKNFAFKFDSKGNNRFEISADDFESAKSIDVPTEFVIRRYNLPDALREGEVNMHSPVRLEIENPTGAVMYLSAKVHKDNCPTAYVSGIKVAPGKSVVTLDSPEIRNMFCPFTSDVLIYEIMLHKEYTAVPSGIAPASTIYSYTFGIDATLPLVFYPGDGIVATYQSEVFDNAGVIDAIESTGLDLTNLMLEISAVNTLPFDIHLGMDTMSGETRGSVSADKDIAAGTEKDPSTTDFKVSADVPGGIHSLRYIQLNVSAVVPETFTSEVVLNANQNLSLKVNNADMADGFTFTL